MTLRYTREAQDDLQHWARHDRAELERIKRLVTAIEADPFTGIGKPEILRGNLTGLWSRRIDHEHRLAYRVESAVLMMILAARKRDK